VAPAGAGAAGPCSASSRSARPAARTPTASGTAPEPTQNGTSAPRCSAQGQPVVSSETSIRRRPRKASSPPPVSAIVRSLPHAIALAACRWCPVAGVAVSGLVLYSGCGRLGSSSRSFVGLVLGARDAKSDGSRSAHRAPRHVANPGALQRRSAERWISLVAGRVQSAGGSFFLHPARAPHAEADVPFGLLDRGHYAAHALRSCSISRPLAPGEHVRRAVRGSRRSRTA
jgi:hypothetical protein